MGSGADLFQVAENIWTWEHFSDAHKVELTSSAVRRNGKLYLFDPILPSDKALGSLTTVADEKVIVLTNENHLRAASELSQKFNASIWIGPHAQLELPQANRLPAAQSTWEGWRLHPLPGATPGEIAFEAPELSLMVFGDAIINPPNRGIEMLPEKYCVDQRALETELRQLASSTSFEIALTAHGKPIPAIAVNRIRLILRLQSDLPPQSPKN
jgi:glyoxylase-like metal-dependent hydrolase (beta-lactamase superfamily II)